MRSSNPLEISRDALDADKSDIHFKHLKSLLSLKAKESWKKDIDYLRQEVLDKEETYRFWVRSLWHFLEGVQESKKIKGIILHLYSRRDICQSCTLRLTREWEYDAGFVVKLKSIVCNKDNEEQLPFFRILASCNEIRYEDRNKHTDQFSDMADYLIPIVPQTGETDEEKKAIFFQKLIRR